MLVYNCDFCGGTHKQVHVLLTENEMGILHVIALCDDCSDGVDFEYEYLLSLREKEGADKYGLFS